MKKKVLMGVCSKAGLECLKYIHSHKDFNLVGIMENSRKNSWHQHYGWDPQEYAKKNGIDLIDSIIETEHDYFFSVLYWNLLNQREIDASKKLCLNFHLADARKYRGCGLFTHAILNDESEYGVTCHKIATDIDKGDIYQVKTVPINDDDTAISLYFRVSDLAISFFKEVANKISRGEELTFYKNNSKKYYPRDLLNEKMEKIDEKKVRAYYFPPFKPAFIKKNNTKIFCLPENPWDKR